MKSHVAPFLINALACSLACVSSHAATLIVNGDDNDRTIGLDDLGNPVLGFIGDGSLGTADDNASFGKDDQAGIAVFQLPDLNGETIVGANLDFVWTGGAFLNAGGSGLPKGVDLYALRSDSSSTVLTTDYGFGAAPGNGTLIQDDLLVFTSNVAFPGAAPVETDATADAALASWLASEYNGGAVAGDYVFFRLNLDDEADNGAFFGSANNSTAGNRPVLTIETAAAIPEPGSLALLSAGGLVLLFRRRRCRA